MCKILISESVQKELISIFKSQKIIDILINKIKIIKIDDIYLKRPFVKIKVSIFNDTFRIIGEYRKLNKKYVN